VKRFVLFPVVVMNPPDEIVRRLSLPLKAFVELSCKKSVPVERVPIPIRLLSNVWDVAVLLVRFVVDVPYGFVPPTFNPTAPTPTTPVVGSGVAKYDAHAGQFVPS
jgi:hypothetical protein